MPMLIRLIIITLFAAMTVSSQQSGPPIEPGVSQALAQWRAANYTDVRYKLNLALEKMSPVLKGTMEIRVNVLTLPRGVNFGGGLRPNGAPSPSPMRQPDPGIPAIILDWRKLKGHETDSTISNVTINGTSLGVYGSEAYHLDMIVSPYVIADQEHLIFRDGVVPGENVIKLDFTSPILTSGSAITRYVDKEDGAEYIYSLFVPSDASTAFPVFDQPDLKARFTVQISTPRDWSVVSNTAVSSDEWVEHWAEDKEAPSEPNKVTLVNWWTIDWSFQETKPISTYVFAFAAGPFEAFEDKGGNPSGSEGALRGVPSNERTLPTGRVSASGDALSSHIYVRKSQAKKFEPHSKEVFRLNREGIKYLETYFDYKFPFPKYDLVLIPEFPFGGMEHAGATFLREASIIFPTEPTKSDHISRANLIFHEAAHQWFGDTVTMRWFDDLWLKEGFAEFMAYKTLEKVMPDANAWKVFYERNKQAAYLTDSTKGTTPIYQKIDNLSAAKSAYGNIVYRKAPSFLRQAEFYLGPDYFQTGVRAFLKKYEFRNAEWTDLINEIQKIMKYDNGTGRSLNFWAKNWITKRGLAKIRVEIIKNRDSRNSRFTTPGCRVNAENVLGDDDFWDSRFLTLMWKGDKMERLNCFTRSTNIDDINLTTNRYQRDLDKEGNFKLTFPNYGDYGYGIFLMDKTSREFVAKNLNLIDDDFVRSMMWGSLWDSVRENDLDPKVYVELVIKHLTTEQDETIIQSLLGRVGTAMNYYLPDAGGPMQKPAREQGLNTQRPSKALANARASATDDLRARLESVLLDKLQHAPTAGQRITFYRAFVTTASTAKGREVLKEMLSQGSSGSQRPAAAVSAGSRHSDVPLRTKDRFDIVTRLIILGDPEVPKLLAQLEKTETGDDAKRYAYAARAGIATAENKAKYWSDFTANKDISESWIEAAFGPFNSVLHSDLTLPYLERALAELPNHKRTRKIFFVNGWLGAFIGGQKSEAALAIVNKFLADTPNLDRDLRLKILENVDLIERAVKIRKKFSHE
ncbi:MAG: M1 family aminopeptidase [Pyrinomonadaceae bacterium]|nr:ERAP1-like C-terminal domain-containing protein [Pyrinomonadaceae bacterium]